MGLGCVRVARSALCLRVLSHVASRFSGFSTEKFGRVSFFSVFEVVGVFAVWSLGCV